MDCSTPGSSVPGSLQARTLERVAMPSSRLRWGALAKRFKSIEGGHIGPSLADQWLRLGASAAGGVGLIPGWGTKIPHAMLYDQKQGHMNAQRHSAGLHADRVWDERDVAASRGTWRKTTSTRETGGRGLPQSLQEEPVLPTP